VEKENRVFWRVKMQDELDLGHQQRILMTPILIAIVLGI
jgi:hypothetical protein